MQKTRIPILALTVVTMLALPASSAQAGPTCSANKPLCTASFQPEPVLMSTSTWTFEGCWSYFLTSPCRDIFRDSAGAYWICANCGQTKNPGPGSCRQVGIQALDRGF